MEYEKKMPRYLMQKFDLLRFCGKTGKTKVVIDFNNDIGEGIMKITTEDEELLFLKGVEELREKYGDKLAP